MDNNYLTYLSLTFALKVYRELGSGRRETIYHRAMAYEFDQKGIDFRI